MILELGEYKYYQISKVSGCLGAKIYLPRLRMRRG